MTLTIDAVPSPTGGRDAYLDQVKDGIDDIEESGDKARDGDKAGTQAAAKRVSARNPDAEPITGKGACAG